jgi:hypothetical protein
MQLLPACSVSMKRVFMADRQGAIAEGDGACIGGFKDREISYATPELR